jgi:hypothetical protein
MTLGSLKPAIASDTLRMPLSGRMTITNRATTSMRGLSATNIPMQANSSPMTKNNWGFTAVKIIEL